MLPIWLCFTNELATMYRFEQTGEFFAHSEDGRQYHVLEYAKVINLADPRTPTRWEAVGPKEYRLSAGERVNMLSETDFVIVGRRPMRIKKQSENS